MTRNTMLLGEDLLPAGRISSAGEGLPGPDVCEDLPHLLRRQSRRRLFHLGQVIPHIRRDIGKSLVHQAVLKRRGPCPFPHARSGTRVVLHEGLSGALTPAWQSMHPLDSNSFSPLSHGSSWNVRVTASVSGRSCRYPTTSVSSWLVSRTPGELLLGKCRAHLSAVVSHLLYQEQRVRQRLPLCYRRPALYYRRCDPRHTAQ